MNYKKHKKLKALFPDKRLVRVVSCTEAGRKVLTPKMRWLYSCLIWRFKGRAVSKRQLAGWSGLDRTRTLPRILDQLIALGLVRIEGKKYAARKPPSDQWFATYRTPDGTLRLASNWAVYEPGRDIIDGLVQAADAINVRPAAVLAGWFGVHRDTIKRARDRLRGIRPCKAERYNAATTVEKKEKEMPVIQINPIARFETLSLEGLPDDMDPVAKRAISFFKISDQDVFQPLNDFVRKQRPTHTEKQIFSNIATLVQKYGNGEELADYLICGGI